MHRCWPGRNPWPSPSARPTSGSPTTSDTRFSGTCPTRRRSCSPRPAWSPTCPPTSPPPSSATSAGCRTRSSRRPEDSYGCGRTVPSRVHPLLRRHLLDQLRRRPSSARAAVRRAARRTAELGDLSAAISIAVDDADWDWAAEALVESLHVPRLLVSGRDPLLDRAEVVDNLGVAQPMLLASAALGRSWPEVAARAVAEATARPAHPGPSSPAAQLSESLVRMALARWDGDPESGLEHQRQAVALLPTLSVAQRAAAPELAPLLQSHAGAFEAMNGAPERARVALERGARAFRPKPAPVGAAASVAAAACLGQLAWQEAVAGQLSSALRHAAGVLTARPADSNEVGVVYAQLATTWCQISRDELEQAVQRFQSVTSRRSFPPDGALLPELAMATGLVAARLGATIGHPGVGLRVRPRVQGTAERSPVRASAEPHPRRAGARFRSAGGRPPAARRRLPARRRGPGAASSGLDPARGPGLGRRIPSGPTGGGPGPAASAADRSHRGLARTDARRHESVSGP